MSFAALKKNRKNQIESLVSAAEKLSGGKKSYEDDRFWTLTRDKAGNGYAVIRFLPEPEGNDVPWTQYWDHSFQGPSGQWYIEKSRTTIGEDDPVGELNGQLWNSTKDDKHPNREQARAQKRRQNIIANIYVVHDQANPDNEGKVFLFKFGKKILDKIMDAMKPQYPDEAPMDPFDLWTGANFKLKAAKVDGWVNYDKSSFDKPSPLSEDDDVLKAIYEKEYDLREFTDPSTFKSYDELKKKLEKVLGITASVSSMMKTGDQEAPPMERKAAAQTRAAAVKEESDDEDQPDDEKALSYFTRLAQGE